MASADDAFEIARSSTAPWDDERREQVRVPVRQPGTLEHQDKQYDCTVLNISTGGVLVKCDADMKAGDVVILRVREWGNYECEVRRQAEEGYGMMFLKAFE